MRSPSTRLVFLLAVLVGCATGAATPAHDTAVAKTTRVARILRAVVNDINDRGQVVGGVTRLDGEHGFLWFDGGTTFLGQGPWVSANAINERGQIIGTSESPSDPAQHAVLWKNGRMTDLGFDFVTAINERGQVIGSRLVSSDGFSLAGRSVTWTNGKARDLWPNGNASAINDLGEVVGESADGHAVAWRNCKLTNFWQICELTDLGPGVARALNGSGEIVGDRNGDVLVWQNGTSRDLGPGMPVAINARGQITGWRQTAPGIVHAFLWQDGTATDLGTLGGTLSFPTAISARGQIVGYSMDSRGVQHGFLWQAGSMTSLPSPTREARTRAIAINNRNQIVGDNCYEDCGLRHGPSSGSTFVVLWTVEPHGIKTVRLLGRS